MFVILVLSIFIMISSSSWFMIWLGLELNTIIFLMIGSDLTSKKTEFEMKYFIIQVVGSSLFVAGWVWSWSPVLFLSLIIKMILFPFLTWIYECLKWVELYILWIFLLIQKLGPVGIFFNLGIKSVYMLVMLNFFFPLILGIMKKSSIDLLILSSVSQISVTFLLSVISWFFFLYLIIYSVMVSLAWLSLKKNSKNLIFQFMILMGLPPSILFIMKSDMLMLLNLNLKFSVIVAIFIGIMAYLYLKFFMNLFFNLSYKFYTSLVTNFMDKITEMISLILAFTLLT